MVRRYMVNIAYTYDSREGTYRLFNTSKLFNTSYNIFSLIEKAPRSFEMGKIVCMTMRYGLVLSNGIDEQLKEWTDIKIRCD